MAAEEVSVGSPQLGINDRMGLISLIDEGMRLGSSESPIVADLFSELWDLVNQTVSGSKISSLKPEESQNGFRVFEANSESGENLGRLNMMYLKKPIPCYYLIYVEVAAVFRKKGLGNRIIEHFREFLDMKSAVGILDNIIPEDDPTYDIYLKQAWEPIEDIIGDAILGKDENYMVYVPARLRKKPIREPLMKLVYHIKRKRAAIDMRDNEVMVNRTLKEFKDLHAALLTYFKEDIRKGEPSTLMRFMFTRFVTKFIAFRRRIADLLGYTGGESTEQVVLPPEIASMPVQSYAPREIARKPSLVSGDKSLWKRLPDSIKDHPAGSIESLSNYLRPSLVAWLEEKGGSPTDTLTIGDFMDLGFDPTRLKEILLDGDAFIFERIHVRQIPDLLKKQELLEKIKSTMPGTRARNALMKTNPPLLTIRDRGNAYVLRRKIEGIHWEEAVEQLQSSPRLKSINNTMKVDKMTVTTVKKVYEVISEKLDVDRETLRDLLSFFVSWDLRNNQPKLIVEFSSSFLESVWMA